jgi:hypothetical protein
MVEKNETICGRTGQKCTIREIIFLEVFSKEFSGPNEVFQLP